MDIVIVVVAAIFFCIGVVSTLFYKSSNKYDGRMIVGDDEYFVAITASPEELKKKTEIVLKVYIR